MPFTFRPHDVVTDRYGIPTVQEKANYIMLCNAGETVYVQQGQVYCGDFDRPTPTDKLPTWFWDSYRKMTSEARIAVGLKLPEDEIQHIDQLPAEFLATLNSLPAHLRAQLIPPAIDLEKAPRMDEKAPKIPDETSGMWQAPDALKNDSGAPKLKSWVCDQCGELVPLRKKGIHIGAHRRAQIAAERAQVGVE